MTIDQLRTAIARQRNASLKYLMLVLPRKPGRRFSRRMRVCPGVLGEIACVNDAGHTVVWCRLDDLERAIAKERIR